MTWEAAKQRILRTRPHISFLENVVPVCSAGAEDEDGIPRESDAAYVKTTFEDQGFSCIDLVVSARDFGSATERKRWFCVVFDIPKCNKAEITNNFFEIMNSMKVGPGNPEDFLIDNAYLAELLRPGDDDGRISSDAPQAKASKGEPNWKHVHEEAFSQYGVKWPPVLSEDLLTFRYRREGEVAFFGGALFPSDKPDRWEFFDVNRTLERTFKYPPKQPGGQLSNPWKEWVPCLTAHSCIVGRIHSNGQTLMKRIHGIGLNGPRLHLKTMWRFVKECDFSRPHDFECRPAPLLAGIEAMQLMGWDVSFYKDGVAPFWKETVTPDVLVSLAGNAWSAFSVAPLFIASIGCAPWEYYKTAPPPNKDRKMDVHSSSDDGSSDSD